MSDIIPTYLRSCGNMSIVFSSLVSPIHTLSFCELGASSFPCFKNIRWSSAASSELGGTRESDWSARDFLRFCAPYKGSVSTRVVYKGNVSLPTLSHGMKGLFVCSFDDQGVDWVCFMRACISANH